MLESYRAERENIIELESNRVELEKFAVSHQERTRVVPFIYRIARRTGQLVYDAVLINIAFLLAYYIRYVAQANITFDDGSKFYPTPLTSYYPLEIVITAGLLFLFIFKGLYQIRSTGNTAQQLSKISSSTITLFTLLIILQYFNFHLLQKFIGPQAGASRGLIIYTLIAAIVIVSLGHMLLSWIIGICHRLGLGNTRLLVVGSGRLGKMMMQNIAANQQLGYDIIGFIHDLESSISDFGRFKVLGTMDEMEHVIQSHKIDEVLIALPAYRHQQILKSLQYCEKYGVTFRLIPDLYEFSLSKIDVAAIEGIPIIGLKQSTMRRWAHGCKRLMDLIGSLIILVLGLPLWLLIALAIRLDSQGPVLYKQTRVGYRGKPFILYKYRSMHKSAEKDQKKLLEQNEADGPIFKIRNDPRCTRVGRILRRTSIDEIPQMINVLKGEMSLVGPRPPLPNEVQKYEDWQFRRLDAVPGLTGLWQVRGRSELDFEEMVLMDMYYIENWSLQLDLLILMNTIPAVFLSHGAY